ncbi:MAG: helix-turn-helix domain-containing protein [Ekhidna sp.]
MIDFLHPSDDFLQKVIEEIERNLSDEHFEVPDLADALNMSRSSLLRKVKSASGLSVSVFIRKVRLHHAKQLLSDDSFTSSEVSFKVGFNSTSYFTKCFREEFGHTPGEKAPQEEVTSPPEIESGRINKMTVAGLVVLLVMISVLVVFQNLSESSTASEPLQKTIAVLPFKNDSDDSSNTHIVNGLMESILDNLQRIEDLDVTSRTSVEKYRDANKTIREISDELEVNYFVEGSGQKVGNQIMLTIQLIDARSDKHLWSQQYKREAKDIFKLQTEVAMKIASKIEAIITPKENELIEKIPTENLVAYDYFLQGADLLNRADGNEMIWSAIDLFNKAIEEDIGFAKPYAYIAICYYYLEIFQAEKKYGQEINTYADKAFLYDPELPESLLAKGLFYQQDAQYQLAITYFQKVLDFSPNETRVHNFLSEIYTYHIPNTEKYLIHAIQGIKSAVAEQDSTLASNTYLHLSSALAQNGFIREAESYVQKSISLNPENLFSQYLAIYIQLAQNFDLKRTRADLKSVLRKDTSRLDIIQEIAKVNYTLENYEEAWIYYKKFLELKTMWGLDIYNNQDINIAYVLEQLGREEEADVFYSRFLNYAQNDVTIYKDLHFSSYYAAKGKVDEGIDYLKAFTKQSDYQYWIVLFLDEDPVMKRLSLHPDYEKNMKLIEENFWSSHRKIKALLSEEGII